MSEASRRTTLRSIDAGALRRLFEGRRGEEPRLPGPAAQMRMAPPHRDSGPKRASFRDAAVLVLFYSRGGSLYFPLTLRSEDTGSHKGQVSLPGGSREEGETLVETALRETREEIGVDPALAKVIGRLSALDIPHSGFHVHPFVAFADAAPSFALERREVAELIETPLAELLAEDAARFEERSYGGGVDLLPYYRLGGHKVWGATAMILAELREILAPLIQ
ncbi:MAG TPA: CoA pyrophosphatase [Rectinemataceae bacterium]|nr:CoA pyrophosphatase [Rectinemataceae bacterium]